MPVWHESTKDWVRQGRLKVLGIAQEMHADRCRLFAQWKGFDFPILHDPVNLVGAEMVPLMIAIDEYGVVREVGPKLEGFEQRFIDAVFEEPSEKPFGPVAETRPPDVDVLRERAQRLDSGAAWRNLGDSLVLWFSPDRIDEAIKAYQRGVEKNPESGAGLFRLGVSYSIRFESEYRQSGDFQNAVELWNRTMSINPNQYIWRRRFQQYGPGSDKPYPFYGWMEQAVKEIKDSGQEPVSVRIPPSSSETIQPVRDFQPSKKFSVPPDPENKIFRDSEQLIKSEVTIVPSSIAPGDAVRVFVFFRPNETLKAHWNNESEPLRLWIELPEGWQAVDPLLSAPQPEIPESSETRRIDFDIYSPKKASPGKIRINAYALYYACEGINGTCQFLRQDIAIETEVKK